MKKRILPLLLLLIMLLALPCTVYAEGDDDKSYGWVNFSADMSNMARGGGNVIITITNTTLNKDTTISLQRANGNKYSLLLEPGSYTLKSSKVTSSDGLYELNFRADMDDFVIDLESNPTYEWNIVAIVRANYKKDTEKNNDTNKQQEETKEDNKEVTHGEEVLRFDSTNAYFPEYTVKEIKVWYVKNVNDFIATGKTDKTLQFYQEDVAGWADLVTDSSEARLRIAYGARVEQYNKEETQDFYLVQKRIYDFIKDYTKETGRYLNFETWDDIEDIIPDEIDPLPTPTDEPEQTIKPTDEPNKTDNDDSKLEPEEPSKDEGNLPVLDPPDEKPSKLSRFFKVVKNSWLTLLLLVFALTCGIVFKMKNKKD